MLGVMQTASNFELIPCHSSFSKSLPRPASIRKIAKQFMRILVATYLNSMKRKSEATFLWQCSFSANLKSSKCTEMQKGYLNPGRVLSDSRCWDLGIEDVESIIQKFCKCFSSGIVTEARNFQRPVHLQANSNTSAEKPQRKETTITCK